MNTSSRHAVAADHVFDGMVVHRHAMKDRIGRLIDYLAPAKDKAKKAA